MILIKFSYNKLINSKVHLLLSSRRWNNYVKSFVLMKYRNFYFINLFKTIFNLKLTLFFITTLTYNRGNLVLIEKREEYFFFLKRLALYTKQKFIGKGWLCGSFKNFSEFRKNWKEYRRNDLLIQNGYYNLTRLPEVALCFSLYENSNAIQELKVLGIPTITLISSDLNPAGISFIVPSNDVSESSVLLFMQIFRYSILKGYKIEKIKFYKLLRKFCYLVFIKKLIVNKTHNY